MDILLKREDLPKALERVKSWNLGGGSFLMQGCLTGEMIFAVGLTFWVDKWPDFSFILLATGTDYKYTFFENVSTFVTKDPSYIQDMLLKTKTLKRKELIMGNYPLKYKYIYEDIMKQWKSTVVFTVNTKSVSTDENSLRLFELPENYTASELTAEDAAVLNAHWVFSSEGSLKYIQDHILNFPSMAIRDVHGTLVAWELSYYTGAMGMLYVKEDHRRKGLAKFIIFKLATKLLKLGRNVYCFIEDDNVPSIDLHVKCGFTVQEGHDGYFAKLINDHF